MPFADEHRGRAVGRAMVATGSDRDDDVAETGGRIDRRRIAGHGRKSADARLQTELRLPELHIDDRSGP